MGIVLQRGWIVVISIGDKVKMKEALYSNKREEGFINSFKALHGKLSIGLSGSTQTITSVSKNGNFVLIGKMTIPVNWIQKVI